MASGYQFCFVYVDLNLKILSNLLVNCTAAAAADTLGGKSTDDYSENHLIRILATAITPLTTHRNSVYNIFSSTRGREGATCEIQFYFSKLGQWWELYTDTPCHAIHRFYFSNGWQISFIYNLEWILGHFTLHPFSRPPHTPLSHSNQLTTVSKEVSCTP